MKLNIKPDCENSPKKELLKNLTIYFVTYDIEKAMEYMDDNVIWTLTGDKPLIGKEQFKAALLVMNHNKATELTIHNIITHGRKAAINGEILMNNGDNFGFSDFYEFTNAKKAKVKKIVSYVVQL